MGERSGFAVWHSILNNHPPKCLELASTSAGPWSHQAKAEKSRAVLRTEWSETAERVFPLPCCGNCPQKSKISG
eukprot:1228219-Rhodomonas_salina.1